VNEPSQRTDDVESTTGVIGMPNRDDALRLLHEWVDNDGLRKHMLAVEASVRHYAKLRGADPDVWGLAGLLHDLDWEKHPDRHPLEAVDELRAAGYPEEVLHAILAHRSDFTGVEPETDLDKVLVACDELSGLVFAACLVRPNGVDDLEPKSVVKKLKDKTFAAGVSREEVERGVALIGLERSEHIRNVIEALRAAGSELGITARDVAR
jgi:putative nucleotidyltransferase with HDIG domain